MTSSKRIGFFWGEEKITLVECEKNVPRQIVSVPVESKTNSNSPFSSNLTEEFNLTTILQKVLQDNQMTGGSFYVSLPLKEIILRSFDIPSVKNEEIQSAIKFEAKKYLPIDIQELTYVYYKSPYTENKNKRLKIILFAVRKESLDRYERIFKQANVTVSFCEPSVVSLTKILFFKKEISATEHFAFLMLDKNFGRICFINHGIPQYVREFSISPQSLLNEPDISVEALNLRILNDVANSLDFYARQFSGDKLEHMLVLSETVGQDLFKVLESELKMKLRKVSPIVTMGEVGQNNDANTMFAMGACLDPPLQSLSGFNFLADNTPKFDLKDEIVGFLKVYQETVFVFLICLLILVGAYVFFQVQLKVVQQQYSQLSSRQGAFQNVPVETIQAQVQQTTDKVTADKNIRMKSDLVFILLRVASHLPKGALLKTLSVDYDQGDSINAHVTIKMSGDVFKEDTNEEIKVVNRIFSDFKNDKELSQFIGAVTVSLNLEEADGRQVTGFTITCS